MQLVWEGEQVRMVSMVDSPLLPHFSLFIAPLYASHLPASVIPRFAPS